MAGRKLFNIFGKSSKAPEPAPKKENVEDKLADGLKQEIKTLDVASQVLNRIFDHDEKISGLTTFEMKAILEGKRDDSLSLNETKTAVINLIASTKKLIEQELKNLKILPKTLRAIKKDSREAVVKSHGEKLKQSIETISGNIKIIHQNIVSIETIFSEKIAEKINEKLAIEAHKADVTYQLEKRFKSKQKETDSLLESIAGMRFTITQSKPKVQKICGEKFLTLGEEKKSVNESLETARSITIKANETLSQEIQNISTLKKDLLTLTQEESKKKTDELQTTLNIVSDELKLAQVMFELAQKGYHDIIEAIKARQLAKEEKRRQELLEIERQKKEAEERIKAAAEAERKAKEEETKRKEKVIELQTGRIIETIEKLCSRYVSTDCFEQKDFLDPLETNKSKAFALLTNIQNIAKRRHAELCETIESKSIFEKSDFDKANNTKDRLCLFLHDKLKQFDLTLNPIDFQNIRNKLLEIEPAFDEILKEDKTKVLALIQSAIDIPDLNLFQRSDDAKQHEETLRAIQKDIEEGNIDTHLSYLKRIKKSANTAINIGDSKDHTVRILNNTLSNVNLDDTAVSISDKFLTVVKNFNLELTKPIESDISHTTERRSSADIYTKAIQAITTVLNTNIKHFPDKTSAKKFPGSASAKSIAEEMLQATSEISSPVSILLKYKQAIAKIPALQIYTKNHRNSSAESKQEILTADKVKKLKGQGNQIFGSIYLALEDIDNVKNLEQAITQYITPLIVTPTQSRGWFGKRS